MLGFILLLKWHISFCASTCLFLRVKQISIRVNDFQYQKYFFFEKWPIKLRHSKFKCKHSTKLWDKHQDFKRFIKPQWENSHVVKDVDWLPTDDKLCSRTLSQQNWNIRSHETFLHYCCYCKTSYTKANHTVCDAGKNHGTYGIFFIIQLLKRSPTAMYIAKLSYACGYQVKTYS